MIKPTEILMFTCFLPCDHLTKTTHGGIRKLRIGILNVTVRVKSLSIHPIRTGGRIRKTTVDVEYGFLFWMETGIRKLEQEIENSGNVF